MDLNGFIIFALILSKIESGVSKTTATKPKTTRAAKSKLTRTREYETKPSTVIRTVTTAAVTFAPTISPLRCELASSNNGPMCFGKCDVRNSTCDSILEHDIITCGCVYCLFDPRMGMCRGACKNRYLQRCIKKIPIPTQDSDCGCATCYPKLDSNGVLTCVGHCFQSGLTCKINQMLVSSNNNNNTSVLQSADVCMCS